MKRLRLSLRRKVLDGIRIFNKHIFNRLTLRLAERGVGPFSVLHHAGRRSGRAYRTPVLATYVEDIVIIPLSYGEHVDWLRNVVAQGGSEIMHKGKWFRAANPEVIDASAALALLPEKRRKLFERYRMISFLRLQVVKQ